MAINSIKRWPELTVLLPFIVSRLLLAFIGWMSRLFPGIYREPNIEVIMSPHRLIDIWARWDSGWYIAIIEQGYSLPAEGYSPTAFFPLYPYLVKYVHFWLAPAGYSLDWLLVTGILLSNAFFLVALLLIYRLVMLKTKDHGAAYRTALYLCVAPFSFVFSSFYTESLFLLLTVGAFYAAERRAWGWAAVAGLLAGMTRATGVVIGLPLLLIWWRQWLHDEARPRSAWAALAPVVGLGLFSLLLWNQVGEPLSFMTVGDAWGNRLDWPWRAFASDQRQVEIHGLNVVVTLLFIGLSVLSFRFGTAYGVWALVTTLSPLMLKGSLVSTIRYLMVVFPVFMTLGWIGGRWPRAHDAILLVSAVVMSVLMALWSEGFFVA